jgi:hypothetical protein
MPGAVLPADEAVANTRLHIAGQTAEAGLAAEAQVVAGRAVEGGGRGVGRLRRRTTGSRHARRQAAGRRPLAFS